MKVIDWTHEQAYDRIIEQVLKRRFPEDLPADREAIKDKAKDKLLLCQSASETGQWPKQYVETTAIHERHSHFRRRPKLQLVEDQGVLELMAGKRRESNGAVEEERKAVSLPPIFNAHLHVIGTTPGKTDRWKKTAQRNFRILLLFERMKALGFKAKDLANRLNALGVGKEIWDQKNVRRRASCARVLARQLAGVGPRQGTR